MKRRILLSCIALCSVVLGAMAQMTTASSTMTANPWTEGIPYDLTTQGKKHNFVAGMGGWSWDFFAYKQRNWVKKEYQNIARVGFIGDNNTNASEPTSLTAEQQTSINTELKNIAPTGAKNLLLLCDMNNNNGSLKESNWTASNFLSATKDKRRRTNYVKQMELAVKYIESKGYTVVAVAPFNEPDYDALGTSGKSAKAFNAVAEVMQSNTTLKGRVYGPNTLNNSNGKSWYSTVKNNINFVNTHQLDGSFDDYISFWDTGIKDGKRAISDEMHNVLEAMVSMNHGAEYGTWWAYDGVARAEFSHLVAEGSQIAYHEDPDHWMVSGVYRYDDEADRAKIIIGTSERNAVANTMGFLSKGRLAYYDGYGPSYDYAEEVPGGASGSYQEGQTNAERLIHIHTGEDVPIEPINGRYKLVNKASSKVLSLLNGSTIRQSVYQWTDGGLANQVWDVYPIDKKTVADYSYVVIRNANTSSIPLYLDAQAWNMDNGADASVWSDGDALTTLPNVWQRWHLDYVGDGYYHIVNYESGLYLAVDNGGTGNGVNVHQWSNDGSDKLLWKFVPADHAVDAAAPATPTGLIATPQSGSVKLTWTANRESDIYGYMVYRYNNAADIWECIGRKVQGTSFIDNICPKGEALRYRIKALDKSYNFSTASAEVEATTTAAHALVGQWMAYSWDDNTENKLNAVPYSTTLTVNEDRAAFSFDGRDDYMQLPYHVGDMQEMTFAAWVKGSSTTAWQRIFDFGNGEDEYLFLTPADDGGTMRFEIKKGVTTQSLNTSSGLGTGTWRHVAVTIDANKVTIYIDGVENASTADITLRPSDVAPTMSYLGRSQFAVDPAFKGLMSDVRIYNYALSDNEVAALATTAVSVEDVETATLNATTEATELLQHPMYAGAREILRQAVEEVNSVAEAYIVKIEDGTATSADGTTWSNAIKALAEGSAMADARASIENYRGLAAQVAAVRATMAANPRQYGDGTVAELAGVEEDYREGAYADSEIPAVYVELKGITNRYLMADAVALATESNPVDVTALVVSNPSFAGDSYASWKSNPAPGLGYESIEFWNTNYNINQTLIGMPAGTYRFQTRGFYRYGGQPENKAAHDNGTLKRNAKLYITHTTGGTQMADVMAISDDPSEDTYWGEWSGEKYDGKPVPNNMQAADHAIIGCGKYVPRDGYNSVDITVTETGDLTIGAKKETLVVNDWTFFSDFSLYYVQPICYKLTLLVDNVVYRELDVPCGRDLAAVMESLGTPTKEGYTFSGWSEMSETMPEEDIEVVGSFDINSYTITFKAGDEVISEKVLEYGATIEVPAAPEKEGHTFQSWGKVAATVPAEDVTYEAVYAVNSYTVTFVADGEVVSSQSLPYGSAIVAPAAPEKEGHTFQNWGEVAATVPAEDVTYEAVYAVNSYTVTFIADGEVVSSQSLPYGSAIVAPEVEEKEGYTFNGWGEVAETVPVDGATYEGSYTVNKYTVSYYFEGDLVYTAEIEFGAEIPEYIYDESPNIVWKIKDEEQDYTTMPAKDLVYVGELDTTGLDRLSIDSSAVIYDLSGRRVLEAVKGFYIINGKKVFVK